MHVACFRIEMNEAVMLRKKLWDNRLHLALITIIGLFKLTLNLMLCYAIVCYMLLCDAILSYPIFPYPILPYPYPILHYPILYLYLSHVVPLILMVTASFFPPSPPSRHIISFCTIDSSNHDVTFQIITCHLVLCHVMSYCMMSYHTV